MQVSLKQIKLMRQNAERQDEVITQLEKVINDIERCEREIQDLETELGAIHVKYKDRKTTREDVDFLSALLRCANKKLNWEKHLASLQKRMPLILQKMDKLINDPNNPVDDAGKEKLLRGLQGVQASLGRLQQFNTESPPANTQPSQPASEPSQAAPPTEPEKPAEG